MYFLQYTDIRLQHNRPINQCFHEASHQLVLRVSGRVNRQQVSRHTHTTTTTANKCLRLSGLCDDQPNPGEGRRTRTLVAGDDGEPERRVDFQVIRVDQEGVVSGVHTGWKT